jgi:hypothetical protein
VSFGGRGICGGGQQGGGAGPGKRESDAWSSPEQELAPGRSWSGGGRRWQSAVEGSRGAVWQNQPELYRLKYASPLMRAPTCFKRYNPLACRVTFR